MNVPSDIDFADSPSSPGFEQATEPAYQLRELDMLKKAEPRVRSTIKAE
jgi:hypothetical protein